MTKGGQMVHYEIKGEEYPIFDNDWSLQEAFFLKEKAYLTVRQFKDALDIDDPHAITALIWIIKRRAGELIDWDTIVKDYKFSDVKVIFDDPDVVAPVEADDSVDPTPPNIEKPSKPAGKDRKSGT